MIYNNRAGEGVTITPPAFNVSREKTMSLPRCKYLSGRDFKRLSRELTYQCRCPVLPLPDMPASIKVEISRDWVTVDDCAKCPMMENYKP
jgi:hypothetical protein